MALGEPKPITPPRAPHHNPGDAGAGAIPFQNTGGVARTVLIPPMNPSDIVRSLVERDYRVGHFPKAIQDITESAKPYPPIAQPGVGQRLYDVFGCSGTLTQHGRRAYGVLAPAAEVVFESAFEPDFWRIYFVTPTTLQILYASPTTSLDWPSEWCQNNGANVKSDVLVIPGRGRFLAIRAASTNTDNLTVTATAEAGNKGNPF